MRPTDQFRAVKPSDREWLWNWTYCFTGVNVARQPVCTGHCAPFDVYADQCLNRPPVTLTIGSRGSGKSFLAAMSVHYTSRFHRRAKTRVLGGSAAQSQQIYDALKAIVLDGCGPLGNDEDTVDQLLANEARYVNGSEARILACSNRSVRGPHVQTLKLDEVDEIPDNFRESAMGMCMAKDGLSAAIDMTSTWHNVGGPMTALVERAEAGEFPLYRFCAFEVLERCPESRSGKHLEKCPDCPLFKYCHEERMSDESKPPKAKISDGHYSIDALIQKLTLGSERIFAADYLCKGPQADGLWFRNWSNANVDDKAEFDPALPVHLAIDSGVRTGAVWFQVKESFDWQTKLVLHDVNVFADYYADGLIAEENAKAIISLGETLCNGRRDIVVTDPAGEARNEVGPTVFAEYKRAGLSNVQSWPRRSVSDGLALLEALVRSASGRISLHVHPRCRNLISAFESYRRAKVNNIWQDKPQDPQHPAEDMIDSLRGGLIHKFPSGRKPEPKLVKRAGSTIKY